MPRRDSFATAAGLWFCYASGVKKSCLILSLFLMAIPACRRFSSSAPEQPKADARLAHGAAQFDFYLLNISWSPEFCQTHPGAAECASHPTFVLHGLWPQNNDGTYPHNCSSAPGPADPSQYSDIFPDPGLLQHEWSTHGTCSGLSPDEYFSAARTAFKTVAVPPKLAGLRTQTSMSPADILGLVTASNPQIPSASLALSCGNNYLTAIEECLDKTLHPTTCSGVRSCRANTVKIPPP